MHRTIIYYEDQILAYCSDKLSVNDVIGKGEELYLVYKVYNQLKTCDLAYVKKVDNDRKK